MPLPDAAARRLLAPDALKVVRQLLAAQGIPFELYVAPRHLCKIAPTHSRTSPPARSSPCRPTGREGPGPGPVPVSAPAVSTACPIRDSGDGETKKLEVEYHGAIDRVEEHLKLLRGLPPRQQLQLAAYTASLLPRRRSAGKPQRRGKT